MTPDEIVEHYNRLITQLGISPDVKGLADDAIGYGNYKIILAEYQQILNDALVLGRETAENQAQHQVEIATKPVAGKFHD